MKKTVIIFLISVLFASLASAQNLLEIYKKGPVKLIAEKNYGAKNDWESLFNLYYDTLSKDIGREENKKIVVAPDGSIYMSHKNRYEIWKFAPNGNYESKFGSKGTKIGQFVALPMICPLAENKYILTTDNGGRINFFDLKWNYIKTINLKYMPQAFQPIGNDNILLLGYTSFKTKSRHIVMKLNINTGNEEMVFDYFTDFPKQLVIDNVDSIIDSKKGNYDFHIMGGFTTVRGSYNSVNSNGFKFLPGGKFIRSDSKTGDYMLYNQDGKKLLEAKMDIEQVKINQADVLEYYGMMKRTISQALKTNKEIIDRSSEARKHNPNLPSSNAERYVKINQKWLDNIDIYKDIKNYYPYFPYYSNLISDDEGNLLVFEFSNIDSKENNSFNVVAYDSDGKKLARTSFICDDYDLSFSESTFVISKGYVYAVAKLRNTSGMPLRLVKLKISN